MDSVREEEQSFLTGQYKAQLSISLGLGLSIYNLFSDSDGELEKLWKLTVVT